MQIPLGLVFGPVPRLGLVCVKVSWLVHVDPKAVEVDFIVVFADFIDPPGLGVFLEEIREGCLAVWPHVAEHVLVVATHFVFLWVLVLWPLHVDVQILAVCVG